MTKEAKAKSLETMKHDCDRLPSDCQYVLRQLVEGAFYGGELRAALYAYIGLAQECLTHVLPRAIQLEQDKVFLAKLIRDLQQESTAFNLGRDTAFSEVQAFIEQKMLEYPPNEHGLFDIAYDSAANATCTDLLDMLRSKRENQPELSERDTLRKERDLYRSSLVLLVDTWGRNAYMVARMTLAATGFIKEQK